MQVRDVMSSEIDYVEEGVSVRSTAVRMAELGVRSLPVCTESHRLIGIVSDRDLVIDALADPAMPESMCVGDLVHRGGAVLTGDDSLDRLVDTLATQQRPRLPVADSGLLVGVVGQAELARIRPEEIIDRILWLVGLDL